MPSRKIVFEAVDDGVHVQMDVREWTLIGSTWVEVEPVLRVNVLSFPGGTNEDWRRDMAVQFVERL